MGINKEIEKVRAFARKAFAFALDTLAPPDPLVREIETMGYAEFMRRAAPAAVEPREDGITAILKYRDPLAKAAILEVKSYGNKAMARILAQTLAGHMRKACGQAPNPAATLPTILIPVPMTRACVRARGWNQCELVGDALPALISPADFVVRKDILQKVRETADQVGKGREERFDNLRRCFGVADPSLAIGRDFIIFDDVLTTGATLSEAASALRAAGARNVSCVALSH